MDKRQMPFAKLQKMVGERVLLTIDLYYPDICHQSRSFELNIPYNIYRMRVHAFTRSSSLVLTSKIIFLGLNLRHRVKHL